MSQAVRAHSSDLRLTWDEFLGEFDWRQGEHLTVLGPTRSGKTTLLVEIIDRQPWVCFLGTKPRDETLERLQHERGFRRVKRWHDKSPMDNRVILWPNSRKLTAPVDQRGAYMQALDEVFEAGGWCIVFDEVVEFSRNPYNMPRTVDRLLGQGASNHLSIVAGSQRPFDIPQRCYSQATHLFLWQTNDMRDLRRFSEISGFADRKAVVDIVQTLPRHDFLYVNTRDGTLYVSNTFAGREV